MEVFDEDANDPICIRWTGYRGERKLMGWEACAPFVRHGSPGDGGCSLEFGPPLWWIITVVVLIGLPTNCGFLMALYLNRKFSMAPKLLVTPRTLQLSKDPKQCDSSGTLRTEDVLDSTAVNISGETSHTIQLLGQACDSQLFESQSHMSPTVEHTSEHDSRESGLHDVASRYVDQETTCATDNASAHSPAKSVTSAQQRLLQ